MPNSEILKKKQESVSEISAKVKDSKAIIVVEYRGINAGDVTNIRADLRKLGAQYCVLKNNISRRALKENNIEGIDEFLTGPVALIFAQDSYLDVAKILYKFSKTNDFYKIKAGVIDGKLTSAEELITLAQLPSREVLIATLAGVLLANISKLAVALDQVKVQKEAQEA